MSAVYTDCTEHPGCPEDGPQCPTHNICQVEVATGNHLPAWRGTGPELLQQIGPHEHVTRPHSHDVTWLVMGTISALALGAADLALHFLR